MPDAYERLVMDVIRGDQTLFMRGDEVEAAWRWIDPIIAAAEAARERPQPYDSYSSGPEDALMLMHRDGRRWREARGVTRIVEAADRGALARLLADEVAALCWRRRYERPDAPRWRCRAARRPQRSSLRWAGTRWTGRPLP